MMEISAIPSGQFCPRFCPPLARGATPLRRAVSAATRQSEPALVEALLEQARVPAGLVPRVDALATRLATGLRERGAGSGRAGLVQSLLQEYALSSTEGVALMCLAEALLRIPDDATRDALIRDKIARGRWQAHLGRSASLFVNAATWGLLLTGKLVATHSDAGLGSALTRLVQGSGGEFLIRKSVDVAMRMLGEQFVAGEAIEAALLRASPQMEEGWRHSFDMLGEAALTAADARRYLRAYELAIDAIGAAAAGRGVYEGPGISIKLSALHPRYGRAQWERVQAELYPLLVDLCARARRYDIGLNIDAEESERLEISLELFGQLACEPQLAGWQGLGFVVQAYQKRAPAVIDVLIDLARRSGRRLMVRLVKGAYWDSEIKRAQVEGQTDYPVYTRKAHTDAAYVACARQLLAAPAQIYPQFATHNARTLATIYELADPRAWTPGQYEFQCLHGMGEPLYEQVVSPVEAGGLGRPCRIYAPVGTHETLLAYLVRRLLENGANTSFVNQAADRSIAVADLVRDPVELIEAAARAEGRVGLPHPRIPLPQDLYGAARRNSRGLDLASEASLRALAADLAQARHAEHAAAPLLATPLPAGPAQPLFNPARRAERIGSVSVASAAEPDAALRDAAAGATAWALRTPAERAGLLDACADLLEADRPQLMDLLMREAGKTAANAVAEIREAADFLRYYALMVRTRFDNTTHVPLGPVVCISPWNFPLAIFLGQVGAALAAGNVVLAKPAEQTPLIAAAAVRALWQAGVPRHAVQLLPGDGPTVGARLVADARVQGVLFTGSVEVARLLQARLAGRVTRSGAAVPLIAETGGQNAMIVDSSALAEQVVADVLTSAFDSAGQRCSALRVLCVQEEVADLVLDMLLGAMAELRVGAPDQLTIDVGPVIDEEARAGIEAHIAAMRRRGRRVHQRARHCAQPGESALRAGCFVLPTVIEIDSLEDLQREVFGPVLHVLRYRREELGALLARIAGLGYGLTMGVHSRVDETIAQVVRAARAGNLYVNRNMVGAVVGVQPFGGEGLSGTGPKAGGPLYLLRLLARRPDGVLAEVFGKPLPGVLTVDEDLAPWPAGLDAQDTAALQAWQDWARAHDAPLAARTQDFVTQYRSCVMQQLPGPTGERNLYGVVPCGAVLGLAQDPRDLLVQLAALLACGVCAVWPEEARAVRASLPAAVQARITLVARWAEPADASDPTEVTETTNAAAHFERVLLHGSIAELARVQDILAKRPGPVISVERLAPGETEVPLERLLLERSVSINTAAAGGNAALMTIG